MLSRTTRVLAKKALPPDAPKWAHHRVNAFGNVLDSIGKQLIYAAGVIIRLGSAVQPQTYPAEDLYRLPRVVPIDGKRATIADNVFIAPSAVVAGDVKVGRKCYIGYNAVIRGDQGHTVVLGESCNVQEKAVVTGDTTIGKWSSVEPMAVVEAADIASCSFVGAGAVVMRGAKMESHTMLCASGVLQAGATIPSGEVWAGNPARKIGVLTEEEKTQIIKAAKHMVMLGIEHHDSWEVTWEELENMRFARDAYGFLTESNFDMRVRAFWMKEPPRPSQRSVRLSPWEQINGRHTPTGGWESIHN